MAIRDVPVQFCKFLNILVDNICIMKRKARFKKRAERQAMAAEEHVKSLLREADEVYAKDKALADRYARMSYRLMQKFKLKLPNYLKKRICKHCHHFLKPGYNCRVRVGKSMITYYCLDCKHYMRFRYKGNRGPKTSK